MPKHTNESNLWILIKNCEHSIKVIKSLHNDKLTKYKLYSAYLSASLSNETQNQQTKNSRLKWTKKK